MVTLVVEDDFTIRLLLQRMLAPFGECHMAVDGEEAVEAFRIALEAGKPYDLVCLDIMMPGMDGQAALKAMRDLEEARGIVSVNGSKIVMVTALGDYRSISTAHWNLCDAYLVKPIDRTTLLTTLADLHLIPAPAPKTAAAPAPKAAASPAPTSTHAPSGPKATPSAPPLRIVPPPAARTSGGSGPAAKPAKARKPATLGHAPRAAKPATPARKSPGPSKRR
jgi:two-component system, chemotaxis family, chemotaxis protein CheY